MRKLTVKVVIGLMVMSMFITSVSVFAEAATTKYTAQPGDSLWSVARKFNTSVNTLKKLNNNWSNKIRVGQKLQVPAPKGWTYTAKRGDSIWKIAKKVGLTANTLKKANGMRSNTIKAGQKLWIPTTTAASTVKKTVSTKSASVQKLSNADLTLLARVIHAEARGESHKGKVAVASVLLNRVKSSKFPNTLKGVVFQRNAFETVSNGSIWLQPNQAAYKAARDAMNGWDPTNGALYFFNPKKVHNPKSWIWTRRVTLKIGNHSFGV